MIHLFFTFLRRKT